MARSLETSSKVEEGESNLARILSDEIASYVDYLGLRRLIRRNHNMT